MRMPMAAIRKIAFSPVVLCFLLVVAAAELSRSDHAAAAPVEDLVGKTVRATLPTGDTIDTRFVDAATVQWKVVAGPRQGEQGEDVVQIARIGPNTFFVNRVESATGDTVSEVYDTQTQRVWMYRTRLNPADVLKRREDMQSVRLELVAQ